MNKENTKDTVIRIAEENGISMDEEGNFIEIDSLRLVTFMLGLEEEFAILIPDEIFELENIYNINVFTNIIGELL